LYLALGNHTNYIYEKAKKKEYLWFRVDGPYGNLTIDYQRYPVILLIAGGIGITPIMGILKDLYRVGDLSEKHPKTANFVVQAVHLVWAVHNQRQYNWFSQELHEMASKSRIGFPTLSILNQVKRIDIVLEILSQHCCWRR
jgi:predicted ferric reductase